MNHLAPAFAIAAVAFASSLSAQRVITTVHGTTTEGGLGTVVRAAGDVDGDGTGDFAVTEPTNGNAGAAYLISGATRARLATFRGSTASGQWGLGTRDASPIGDVNGDGRADFALGYVNRGALDVFSGNGGGLLYRMGPAIEYLQYACAIGDVDGDNRDDFAAYAYINSRTQLWTIRGVSGSLLNLVVQEPQSTGPLRNVGDLTGDGKPEIAICGNNLMIFDLNPIRLLRQVAVQHPGSLTAAEAADWNNDGKQDILLGFTGGGTVPFLVVIEAISGGVLASFTMPPEDAQNISGYFAVLPDVDGDGRKDLVAPGSYDPLSTGNAGAMVVLSGATGRRIGAWPGPPDFPVSSRPVASPGDVDGDGVGDFVIGNANAAQRRGGWQLISGRTLAGMQVKPVNCYAGPFPPTLGITRPVLGQWMTVAGRDAPTGSLGTIAISLLPPQRTNLGVAGCDAWLDPATWVTLGTPPSSGSWQFAVPLPAVQQLSGLEVALQGFFAGTNTPIGFDLTNGVWARFGY